MQQMPSRRPAKLRPPNQSTLLTHVTLLLIVFVVLLPIIWLLSASFKDSQDFYNSPAALFPRKISLVNFEYMFTAIQQLPVYMRNSFILAFGVTTLHVVLGSLAGYAFARMKFRGRDAIFMAIVISLLVPRGGEGGGLMALYELMNFLKMRNSLLGLILLFGSHLPIPLFIMRQAFLSLPNEIEESAMLDGASRWQIFWRIAMPLATGAIVIVATLAFIGVWSDYLVTFTMIDRDSLLTISVGIQKVLTSGYETATANVPHLRGQFASEAADAAMLLFSAFPVIVFYALLQRWFMRGITQGAIKL